VLELPFDPIARSHDVERLVMCGPARRYYRFRYSGHYGGIVTADATGCNLLCAYCWNYKRNLNPEGLGRLRPPEEVAEKLHQIAQRKDFDLFRISGAEPILGPASMQHLVGVIEGVGSSFILETNGIMLGHSPELADQLKGLDAIVSVRVAIKGWDERSFERITGGEGKAFRYQLAALEELSGRGIDVWPAVMFDLFGEDGLREIRAKLREIGIEKIELEELIRYPFVMENLRRREVEIIGE
jgi:uncharacterized Fe-S cluster-containing radical SAM superfamily protein